MRSDDRRHQIVIIIIIIFIIVVGLDKLPSDGFHIVLRPRPLTYTHYNNNSLIWRISPYRTAAPPAICETLTRHNRGELSTPGWGKSSRRLRHSPMVTLHPPLCARERWYIRGNILHVIYINIGRHVKGKKCLRVEVIFF